MKKKQNENEPEGHQQELEILKAVAQAWHSHSTSSRVAPSEFDARRLNFKTSPSRFRIEAMSCNSSVSSSSKALVRGSSSVPWNFRESLWDSYEIVMTTKKLESGINLGDPFGELPDRDRATRKKRESRNSLRNLFNLLSSRRFNEPDVPPRVKDN